MSMPRRLGARKNRKAASQDKVARNSLPWYAKLFWAFIGVMIVTGLVATTSFAYGLIPKDSKATVLSPAARYPSNVALNWGYKCVRAALDDNKSDSVSQAARSTILAACVDPQFSEGLSGSQYDEGTAKKDAPNKPMIVTALQPQSMRPIDANRGVATYAAYVTGNRWKYYAVTIFAADSGHFFMEGLPHEIASPANFAATSPKFKSDAELEQEAKPVLENFFAAYLTNNAVGMQVLTDSGEPIQGPINPFLKGETPYRGITSILIHATGLSTYEAVAFIRTKDDITQLISTAPVRVNLVRRSVRVSDGNQTRLLVESLPDSPTS